MDKNILIQKYSESAEDKVKFAHILDLALKREQRNILTSSSFLNESERAKVELMLKEGGISDYVFWGGYQEAERVCVFFLPDYMEKESLNLSTLKLFFAEVDKFNKDAVFSHRDVLGSLMALGIERESVGDIVADIGKAHFFIKEKVSPFVIENLNKIGRYPVTLKTLSTIDFEKKNDFEELYDTVASLRLDAVVASVYSLSRSSATDAILSGIVSVNGITKKKTDSEIKEGDKITLKGQGKRELIKIDGLSKKGRIRINYLKYK